jgi:hypothetical protein
MRLLSGQRSTPARLMSTGRFWNGFGPDCARNLRYCTWTQDWSQIAVAQIARAEGPGNLGPASGPLAPGFGPKQAESQSNTGPGSSKGLGCLSGR